MKICTLSTYVADQVAALEAGSLRRRRVLRPLVRGLAVLVLIAVVYFGLTGDTQLAVAVLGAGLVGLLVLGVVAMAGPSKRDAAIKRAGAAGENVLPALLGSLPDSWTLLNGVPTPDIRADVDHVLVGPSGVWALEVKHHVGTVQCVGDAWGYSRTGPGGVPREGHIGNPSQQARRAAESLRRYLQARGIAVPVQPVVVFTHPRVELHVEQPTVPVIRAADVLALVSRPARRLPTATCEDIAAALRTLRPLERTRQAASKS